MKKLILIILCLIMIFTVSCKKSQEPSDEFVADEEYVKEIGMAYLSDLFSGNYEEAYNNFPHDEAMTKAVNTQNYQAIFNSVYDQQGNFKSFSGSETSIEGEYIIFTVGVLFEKGKLNANAVFNSKGEVAGINFAEFTFDLASIESLSDDELLETAKAYLGELIKEEYGNAYKNYPHNAQMMEMVNPEKYENIFKELKKTAGDFTGYNGIDISQKGTYRIIAIGTHFEKQNYNMNVTFEENGDIAGLTFSLYTFGEEVLPEGISETDVKFGLEDWVLTGKVSRPEADGIYPALILVHGSGPNNMNERVGLNEPFKDIAHYLAENGIAVLRYDKRTYTYGSEMSRNKELTVYDETIDDAAEAVKFLGRLDYIDKDNIYLLGHSLGGYLMPRIAEMTPKAAGYAMASGIYTSLGEIIPYQIDYLNNIDGIVSGEEEKTSQETKVMADKTLKPDTIDDDEMVLGAYKPYWEDLAEYNPIELARKIEKPVFVFQGDRDYQVPVDQYNLIHDALKQKENFTFKLYPGLNHLLMFGEEKSTPQEYYTKDTVYEPLLEDLIEFIKKN